MNKIDAVELVRKIRDRQYEETKNMNPKERLEYIRKKEVIMRKGEITESFAMELQSWIGNWLKHHILSEDKKIAEFIEEIDIIFDVVEQSYKSFKTSIHKLDSIDNVFSDIV